MTDLIDEVEDAQTEAALLFQAEYEALNARQREELTALTKDFTWTDEETAALDKMHEKHRLEYVELNKRRDDMTSSLKAQAKRDARAAERGEDSPRRRVKRSDHAAPKTIGEAPKPAGRKPAEAQTCVVCGQEIPPSGKRGRPRKVHDECKAAQKVQAASAPPKKRGRPRKIERN